MTFKAVLFDLWETLIQDRADRNQPRRAWRIGAVRELFTRYGFDVDPTSVGDALDATNVALSRLHDEGRDVNASGRAELLLDLIEERCGRRPPTAVAPELLDVIAAMPPEMAPHLAPAAAETLTGLRGLGLATALVSNAGMTTAPNLRLMLQHHGIDSLFDVRVFSDELQVAKPNPRIFEAAMEQLSLSAGECAFVGDNPHNDIAGAIAAGLFAVQVGRKTRDGVNVEPQARIDTLAELIPALGLSYGPK